MAGRLVSDAAWQAVPPVQAVTPYATNEMNQYASVGGASFSYDANGNLTGDGAATYRYDAQNRLVGFTVGSTVVSYAYDAEGRRASRTAGGATVNYLYAMGQEIAEYTGAAPGTLAARHVPGPGLDEPLATVTGTPASRVRVWHHADAQGSVIARSDGMGMLPAAAERYTYTPYGLTGPGSGTAQDGFRWLGRRLEPAAPATLYDMRARAYAAGIGRFMQPDPIGTEGGLNLYAYVENDPLNAVDPTGEFGIFGAIGSVAIGYSIAAVTGQQYTLRNALADAALGVVGAGIASRLNTARQLAAAGTGIARSRYVGALGEEAIGASGRVSIQLGARRLYPDRVLSNVLEESKNVGVISSRDAAQIRNYVEFSRQAQLDPVRVFTRQNTDVSRINDLLSSGAAVQRFLPGVSNQGVYSLTRSSAAAAGGVAGAITGTFSSRPAK